MPATADSWQLSEGSDEEAQFFKKVAAQGHVPDPKQNQQGIYVFTPSGELLASKNESQDPKIVAALLQTALNKWESLPDSRKTATRTLRASPPNAKYPKDGLVLHCNYRDLPRGGHLADTRWNEDYAWFTKAEIKQLFFRPWKVGQTLDLGERDMKRWVRCHFVDMVRGETSPYKPDEVKKARLSFRVTKVSVSIVSFEIKGEAFASAQGVWSLNSHYMKPAPQSRGFDAKMFGYAKYNVKQDKFTQFDMIALGMRWGGTEFNSRWNDVDRNPMGILFTIAGKATTDKRPPGLFFAYGW